MSTFVLQDSLYSTGAAKGIMALLEGMWLGEDNPNHAIHIVSCFGTFNGGVRFYPAFQKFIEAGGELNAIFAGSYRQNLTSKQLAGELLDLGANVSVADSRNRLFHTKTYGASSELGDRLIVSSANFTGRGLSGNVESSVFLDVDLTENIGFSWSDYHRDIRTKLPLLHRLPEDRNSDPWNLLYDETNAYASRGETGGILQPPDTEPDYELKTMIIVLSHADTARINASRGTNAAKGTQYFWLSKDCYDFFPPLTIINERGIKRTFSCEINLRFVDIDNAFQTVRVTFEAENNLDFRLGTGPLRFTGVASDGDIAAISRLGSNDYELRIFRAGTTGFGSLSPYAAIPIGHQGKRFGYLSNSLYQQLVGIELQVE